MSKSTSKARFWVICFSHGEPRKCRTCGDRIYKGMPAWSPYWGGGHYHLMCEATIAHPPRVQPPLENRCRVCDFWFMKEPTSPGCSRCMRLREMAVAV